MTASVLVAYATTAGSTTEVAEAVAETLRGSGLAVEVLPAKQVKSLTGYQAVVLGAPLYMFHWHGDALHFLGRHRTALAALPTVVFALGPFHNKEDELKSARENLDKELAKFAWFSPAAVQVFPGKFDPEKLRFPFSWIGPLKKMPASDERDWEAIRAWSAGIVDLLTAVPA